jgi:hypothetical protein
MACSWTSQPGHLFMMHQPHIMWSGNLQQLSIRQMHCMQHALAVPCWPSRGWARHILAPHVLHAIHRAAQSCTSACASPRPHSLTSSTTSTSALELTSVSSNHQPYAASTTRRRARLLLRNAGGCTSVLRVCGSSFCSAAAGDASSRAPSTHTAKTQRICPAMLSVECLLTVGRKYSFCKLWQLDLHAC